MSFSRGTSHLVPSGRLAGALGLTLASLVGVRAADKDWDNGGGDGLWTNPLNWNADGLPGVADNVFVLAPSNKTITLDTTPLSATVNEISLARTGNQTVTVNHTGGSLTATSWFTLGQGFGGAPNNGTGVWNMSGSSALTLSHAAGQTVVGVGFTVSPNFNTGILTLTDNAVLTQPAADIRIGGEAAASRAHGTVSVSGNAQLLHSGGGTLFVGNGLGNAFLNISGGTTTVGTGGLSVGHNAGSTGTVIQSGGQLSSSGPFRVGGDGSATGAGTYTQSGGTMNVTGSYVAIGTSGTGTYNLSSGTFTHTGGSGFNVGDRTGSKGIMNMSGGSVTAGQLFVGKTGTAAGAIYQSGGNLTFTGTGEHKIGGNGGTANYGYIGLSGGTLQFTANNPQIGASGTGLLRQSAGTFNTTGWTAIGRFNGSLGQADISGGNFNHTGTGTSIIVGEDGAGVLTLSGTAALSLGPVTGGGGIGLRMGHTATGSGIINLSGGTATVPSVSRGTGSGILNFNGGALRANTGNANFMTGLNAAYVYSGGGTIDAQNHAITIAQPLLAPAGSGVGGVSSFTGGAGYIGAPMVTVVRGLGDTTGTGATAVATVNPATGQVTGITITNPGVNYTATPTFALTGGGFTSAATVTGAAPVANTGGGLTITGTSAGSVTLTGANTYTGTTTVNGGTLFMGTASALGASSGGTVISGGATVHSNLNGLTLAEDFTLNNGTLRQGGNPAVDPVLNGTLTATTASSTLKADGGASWTVNGNVTVAPAGAVLNVSLDGSETSTINGTISGAGGLTKASTGILALTQASNTYTGPTAINGGTLSIATGSEQTLGNNPGSFNPAQLSLNGGTLLVSGASLTLNDSNRGVSAGAGGGTFNVGSGLTLALTNPLAANAGGSTFTKTGAGTFNLTAGAQINALVVDQGSYIQGAGTTEILTTSTGLQIRNGANYRLTGGTLKTDVIDVQSGGAFSWEGGTLALRSTNGNQGTADYTAPGYHGISSGITGEITGNLTSAPSTVLQMHGSPTLYLNNGVRFNNWAIDGNLDLSAAGDTVEFELNPYYLRPFSSSGVGATETGSLPLITWTGTFGGGEFDSVTGINLTQGGGFAESAFSVTDPTALALNTWYIEYDAAAQTVWFHFKVSGYVPEPGSFGLMMVGAYGLRLLRARRFHS